MPRILIVDDEQVHRERAMDLAIAAGFAAVGAESGAEALRLHAEAGPFAAILVDLVMPDLDGLGLIAALRRLGDATPIIVAMPQPSPELIATARQCGAIDFCPKPFSPERVAVTLANALRIGQLELALRADRNRRDGVLGPTDMVSTASAAMARPLAMAARAARNALPVLIEGEHGTGKAELARLIHGRSDRAGQPFIRLDCAAIPARDLEAALFGDADRPGRLAAARGGTLYLAEIGHLADRLQARLLEAMASGDIASPDRERPRRQTARLIAGTSRRLLNLARAGLVRDDLYHRLNVLPVFVPPLRDRREDIPALSQHFLARHAAELGRSPPALAPALRNALPRHGWRGNLTELDNALFRALLLSSGGPLDLADMPLLQAAGDDALAPFDIDSAPLPQRDEAGGAADRFTGPDGRLRSLAEIERDAIEHAIERHRGQMSRVARALGIGRSTLYRKLKEYGLDSALPAASG